MAMGTWAEKEKFPDLCCDQSKMDNVEREREREKPFVTP